jgi:hypothetical protein
MMRKTAEVKKQNDTKQYTAPPKYVSGLVFSKPVPIPKAITMTTAA